MSELFDSQEQSALTEQELAQANGGWLNDGTSESDACRPLDTPFYRAHCFGSAHIGVQCAKYVEGKRPKYICGNCTRG